MKWITSALLCVATLLVDASKPTATENLLTQLRYVNSQWLNQHEQNIVTQKHVGPSPKNYNEWITLHLQLVEKTLRERPCNGFSKTQIQHRHTLLDALRQYSDEGVYPINDYLTYKNPVFIDKKGTHCAVGYLMMRSGHDDLAQAIDAKEKFAYVHQIKTAGVNEWASTHGFTIDELAWIQPGYPPTFPVLDMDSGLNATVNAIAADATNGNVYVGGNFTQTHLGNPCAHIGVWQSGFAGWDWIELDGGTNGPVNALLIHNNKLYVGGNFSQAGTLTAGNIAAYNLNTLQWENVGSTDNEVKALALYNGNIYAAGTFTGLVAKWDGSSWININTGALSGNDARALFVWENKLVIGGNFSFNTGAPISYVAAYDGTQITPVGSGAFTPINDFELYNNELYAACDVINGNDTCAIASFQNGQWVKRLTPNDQIISVFDGPTVKTMKVVNGVLLAGGDFYCGAGMTYGSHLMMLERIPPVWGDSTKLMCSALAALDNPVNAIDAILNTLYFGGSFEKNMSQQLNHIAQMQMPVTEIRETAAETTNITLAPNPANNHVQITSANKQLIKQIIVYNTNGQTVLSTEPNNDKTLINVSALPSGIYMVKISVNGQWETTRFVK